MEQIGFGATAPPGAPGLPDDKCKWAAAEGIRLEKKAAEFEEAQKPKEAAFNHKVAAGKFEEAVTLLPQGHADYQALAGYAEELKSRAVYLDSLAGGPISLPFEDFVGDLELTMDVSRSSLRKPVEDDVATLVAKGGTSGASAALREEGFQLVLALKSTPELRTYIDRTLACDGRRRIQGAGTDAQQEEILRAAPTFAALKDALRKSPWVELDIDPKMDKLDMAMKLEKEAHAVETQGNKDDAVDMYNRALAVLQFVYKHDPRTKNAKIKEMIGKRVQELEAKITGLGGVPNPP